MKCTYYNVTKWSNIAGISEHDPLGVLCPNPEYELDWLRQDLGALTLTFKWELTHKIGAFWFSPILSPLTILEFFKNLISSWFVLYELLSKRG